MYCSPMPPKARATRRTKGEGTVFEKDGRYVARYTYFDELADRKRTTQVSGRTKTEAQKKLNDLKRRVAEGKPARDARGTFGSFVQTWIDTSLEVSDRKQSTKSLYAGLARTHIVGSGLGNTAMSAVRPTTVERFVADMRKKGLSDSTVRQIYTVARAVAESAVRDGRLAVNPFGQVKRPKVTRKEASSLEPYLLELLLAEAAGSRYHPLFVFLARTGMRRGEALALRWSDVDLPRQRAHVRGTLARENGALVITEPKTAASRRVVPLSRALATEVLPGVKRRTAAERLRAGSKWQNSGHVFVTELGAPVDPRNALRAIESIAAKVEWPDYSDGPEPRMVVGLPDVGLHTLRHTAATTMLGAGVEMYKVSRILGHTSISITVDTYGHTTESDLLGGVNVLDRPAVHRVTSQGD